MSVVSDIHSFETESLVDEFINEERILIDEAAAVNWALPVVDNEIRKFRETVQHLTGEHEYERKGSDPGLLVIFNQVKFDDSMKYETRLGSHKDVHELLQTFGRLGFNTDRKYIFINSTKTEIQNAVNTIAKEDHHERNCLVVVVLTHGEKDELISAYDGCLSTADIWKPFCRDNCPSFKNKPKLFVIQACKGNSSSSSDTKTTASDVISRKMLMSPFEPDIIVAYSAVEGNRSYRDIYDGTWFIQELCKNFLAYGRRDDVMSLLLRTTKCVSHAYYLQTDQIEKQMPLVVSTLTKKFFLNRSKDRHALLSNLNRQGELVKLVREIDEKVDAIFKDFEGKKLPKRRSCSSKLFDK